MVRTARTTIELLRDRDLGPFLGGNLVSSIGTYMHNIAAAIVIFQITESSFMVGLLAGAQFGPALLLAPWAGMAADRIDQRRLLITTQILSGTAAAALALWVALVGVDRLSRPWPVLAASAVIGVSFAFSIPTHQAMVGSLVPARDLDGALALNSVTFNLARAVGPALAGLAVVSVGVALTFGINAGTFGTFVVALLLIRVRHRPPRSAEAGSIRDGLLFVRSDPPLILLLVGMASLGFGTEPVSTLAPAIAAGLGGDETLVGILVTSFGIGSAVAAAAVTRARQRLSRRALATAGLLLLGAGMSVVAVSGGTIMSVTGLAVAGFGFLIAITSLTAEIYSRVPGEIRGRVLALWGVAFLGSRPIAGVMSGTLADLASTGIAVAAAATIVLLSAVVVARWWTMDRPADA